MTQVGKILKYQTCRIFKLLHGPFKSFVVRMLDRLKSRTEDNRDQMYCLIVVVKYRGRTTKSLYAKHE